MKYLKSTLLIVFLLPVFIGIGCSDNGSDSNDEIPANLVDTWWYGSAAMNGIPIYDYSELSNHDLATTSSITFEADGTWEMHEYGDGPTPIFSQSGTFTISGSNINIRVTVYDGVPQDPPEEFTAQFSVNGNILTMTMTESVLGEELTLVTIYNRET